MKKRQIVKCFVLLALLAINCLILVFINENANQEPILYNYNDQRAYEFSMNQQYDKRCGVSTNNTKSVHYRLSSDKRYHYEFRYELYVPTKDDEHRLMIILYGAKRACSDMWDFSVGGRIISALRDFNYSILAVCSPRKTYDVNLPLRNNKDLKYIYLSIQIWMNTVYYPKFRRYPFLYIHGTSRGSHFAGLLCRILPIQAQLLYTYPGHREAMLSSSIYDADMQTRLSIDTTFSNWFYFDFCYNRSIRNMNNGHFCPFQSDDQYLYPIPPTFFTFLQNDPYQNREAYNNFIMNLQINSIRLGGKLLANKKALQLDVLFPVKLTDSYMQKNFHIWCSKPYASQFFYEHYIDSSLYTTNDPIRQTCWCSDVDFKYFEIMPNITRSWSIQERTAYSDYIRDIRIFQHAFCEEVCGDVMVTHSMVSRNIHKALSWINEINSLRRSLYIDDYVTRPLRIWMYDKNLLIINSTNFSSYDIRWETISKEYCMYSPEYYLQDYFLSLNRSPKIYRHNLQWAMNPLLADYFIISSDLMFFYFHHKPSLLDDQQFQDLYRNLNENYMEILLKNVQTMFPYWTLSPQEDQIGSNHIIIIPGGRNMGILYNKTQSIIKNVIQLAFTGIRMDLLPLHASPQYVYRNIRITYRHFYDVIVPQSTLLKLKRNKLDDIDTLINKKKRLFYFAGALNHITSSTSARSLLSLLKTDIEEKQKYNVSIKVQDKLYDMITIIDGHINSREYIESIQSSVFSLCPEGFLPWSPRIYESIQLGAIPMLLVDNIVLPFERFIDWHSFTVKINVSNIRNITNFVNRIDNLEQYIRTKLKNVLPYLDAFKWPYSIIHNNESSKCMFDPQEDLNGTSKNVFYYITLELRCRRLEQIYGFTIESSTSKSIKAQHLACTNYPHICPCHNEQRSVAFNEYI